MERGSDQEWVSAQVRMVVERLLRRCGEGVVAEAMPAGHEKLLTHIRKTKEKVSLQVYTRRSRPAAPFFFFYTIARATCHVDTLAKTRLSPY